MAGKPVEFHPEAAEELEASAKWYRKQSPKAAAAFIRELEHAIDMIAEAPERWPAFSHGARKYLLQRFPFLIGLSRTTHDHSGSGSRPRTAASWILEKPVRLIIAELGRTESGPEPLPTVPCRFRATVSRR